MKDIVTVMVEDKWIAVDGETIWFERPFNLIPEHEQLWALHWKNNKGEYQFDDPPANFFFEVDEYDKYVQPYVTQWETEKARQEKIRKDMEAAALAEYNKPENVEARAREERDKLLGETDYLLMQDYPLTDEQREAWIVYRQALRDLPDTEGWPMNIVWPTKPE